MENVLVTGAAGFIGLHLVAELARRHLKVYALIEKTDHIGREKLLDIDPDVKVIDDLDNMLQDAGCFPRFDCIFHLAAVGINPNDMSAG